jgi:mannosyltransferase
VAALHGLPADVELRCVGGGAWGDGEHEALPGALRPRVRHLGYVDDEGLNHLYNRALALVYPSRVEGFGIPVLEAMQAACPVVSGPCAALQEVGGEALVAAPSFEGEAIAHALTGLLDDAERARRIQAGQQVAARYSWERTYQETLAVYRELQ